MALRAQQEAAEWEAERVRRDTVAARKAAELEAERGAVAAWQRSGAGDAPAPAAAADSSDSEGEVQAAPVARRPPPVQPPPPRGPLPPLRATTRVEVTLTELQKPNLPARAPLAEQIKVRWLWRCLGSRFRVLIPTQHSSQLRQRSVDDGGANAPVVAALRADARDVTERHPAFLADTAAAKLRSGHAAAALDAYDRALALADAPGAAVTPHARGEMHEGRAAARMQSGDVAGALEDLRAAAALQPESAEAARALAEAEAEAAMTPDELRRAADARASGGDAAGAIAAYGRMLLRADATAAERVAALANRSACRLGAGDAAGSAADVQAALAALLGGDAAAEAAAAEAQRLAGSGDAGAGAEAGGADELKRRATLARLLARRASARGQLGLYGAAAADAAAAAALRRAAGEAAAADALDGDAAALEALHLGTRASPADL